MAQKRTSHLLEDNQVSGYSLQALRREGASRRKARGDLRLTLVRGSNQHRERLSCHLLRGVADEDSGARPPGPPGPGETLVAPTHLHLAKLRDMPFVLEVVRFVLEVEGQEAALFEHVGYMRAAFKRRKDAASYYGRHNPHMRALDAHGTWTSDWDPQTRLAYIVRDDRDVVQTVPPFDPADEPVFRGRGVTYCVTYLK